MKTNLAARRPVRGPLRILLRLPIWLYRLRLGWLLGDRFLMLTHTGRRSGLTRRSVLEVVGENAMAGAYSVAAGWGERSDWFRNIQKNPQVVVDVGRRRFEATAERMSEVEAELAFRDYARRHPWAFRNLGRVMTGQRLAGREDDYRKLARSIPLITLRPKPA